MPPSGRRCSSTSATSSSNHGSPSSPARFHMTASPPPGRSTRAISPGARSRSNQWNASATKTASTDASGSGIASAVPSSTRTPGRRESTRRMPSTGSTATTSGATLGEHGGQLARARREVEHGPRLEALDEVGDRVGGPARPPALVLLRHRSEGGGGAAVDGHRPRARRIRSRRSRRSDSASSGR